MSVEVFEKHYLAVMLDAIKAGNDTATREYERREAEAAERMKVKNADQERLVQERAKAAKNKVRVVLLRVSVDVNRNA